MDLKHLPRRAAGGFAISPYESKIEIGAHNQRLSHVMSEETVGCTKISGGLIIMPPHRIARAHIHKDNEIVLFVAEGWGVALVGPKLEPVYHGPGDFLYFGAGVIHLGINLSSTDRMVLAEIRTDPKFNEDLILLPELNDKTQEIAEDLWKKFDAGEILSEAQTESSVFSYDQAREAYQEPEQNDEQSDSDVSLGGVVDPQPLNA